MIGSFLTRGLVMVFGYAYPAYECYKTIEMNKPDIEQLRFWCQYWILVAMLSVCERVGDTFISWVPMYSEAKLAFFVYLWYPKTKGTTYVYDAFFRPYISKHETEIDRNLLELKARAGDIAVLYWQKAASYVQTRTSEILQYIASQSTPRPRAAEKEGTRVRQHAAGQNRKPTGTTQPLIEEPPSPSSNTSSEHQDVSEEGYPASLNAQQSIATQPLAETVKLTEGEVMKIEHSTSGKENANPPPQTVMEEAIRMTRGRLRRNRVPADSNR